MTRVISCWNFSLKLLLGRLLFMVSRCIIKQPVVHQGPNSGVQNPFMFTKYCERHGIFRIEKWIYNKWIMFNFTKDVARFQQVFPIPSWLTSRRTSGHQKRVPTFLWIDNCLMVTERPYYTLLLWRRTFLICHWLRDQWCLVSCITSQEVKKSINGLTWGSINQSINGWCLAPTACLQDPHYNIILF